MKNFALYISIAFTLMALSACKKTIITKTSVFSYTDISIPGVAEINDFSFPTANVGYIINGGGIYKTINGGESWAIILKEGGDQLAFITDKVGLKRIGYQIKVTNDGGISWSDTSYHGSYIGAAENGNLIYGDYNSSNVEFFISKDKGNNFHSIGKVLCDYNEVKVKCTGNTILVNNKQYQNVFRGIDLNTEKVNYVMIDPFPIPFDSSYSYDKISINVDARESVDIYLEGDLGVAVGGRGMISDGVGVNSIASQGKLTGGYFNVDYSRLYYNHNLQYLSVDGNGKGLVVAVGDKTIASNLDLENGDVWNEVYKTDRNGFDKVFNKIRFIDDKNFVVTTQDGLIWKGSL